MKTILTFIGLKILEISAIVFIPYWIGLAENRFLGLLNHSDGVPLLWVDGVLCIILFAMLVVLLCFMGLAISENWKLAKRIVKK